MPSWTKAVALEVTEARLRRNDLMLLGRHRLRHPRVRLDPAALGIVADVPARATSLARRNSLMTGHSRSK